MQRHVCTCVYVAICGHIKCHAQVLRHRWVDRSMDVIELLTHMHTDHKKHTPLALNTMVMLWGHAETCLYMCLCSHMWTHQMSCTSPRCLDSGECQHQWMLYIYLPTYILIIKNTQPSLETQWSCCEDMLRHVCSCAYVAICGHIQCHAHPLGASTQVSGDINECYIYTYPYTYWS